MEKSHRNMRQKTPSILHSFGADYQSSISVYHFTPDGYQPFKLLPARIECTETSRNGEPDERAPVNYLRPHFTDRLGHQFRLALTINSYITRVDSNPRNYMAHIGTMPFLGATLMYHILNNSEQLSVKYFAWCAHCQWEMCNFTCIWHILLPQILQILTVKF